MTDHKADRRSRAASGSELPLAAAARHLAEKAAAARTREFQPGTTPPVPVASTPEHDLQPVGVAWNAASGPPQAPAGHTNYPTSSPESAPTQPLTGTEPAYSRWWKRACAALLDGVILSVPNGIIFATLGSSRLQTDPVTGEVTAQFTKSLLAAWVLSLVVSLAYYVMMEGGRRGATVGKMALNLTVRDKDTFQPIGYGRALGRRLMGNLFWVLLIIPGILDLLAPLWSSRRQTWHDNIVGSVVVDQP